MSRSHGAEYAVALNGIGGQGVQLVAKVLARAMLDAGAQVMLTSQYGGEMRGGRSYSAVVVAEEAVRALPVIEKVDCVIALHSAHWHEIDAMLTPAGFVVAEAEFAAEIAQQCRPGQRVVSVPARQAALQVENPMGAGIALLGAFSVCTGLVSVDRLSQRLAEALPVYRRQHIAGNERALRAGAAALPAGVNIPLPMRIAAGAAL